MMTNQAPTGEITARFEAFRMIAHEINRKYKEAQQVIQRLNNEVAISREVENNLRNQLSRNQERLVELTKHYHGFCTLQAKSQAIEGCSKQTEAKLKEMEEMMDGIKQRIKNILTTESHESELKQKNNDLKVLLKKSEAKTDFLVMEVQTLLNEKKNIVSEYEERIRGYQMELKKTKQEILDVKSHSDETVLMYRKQITDYENTLRQYEKERASIIEEFNETSVSTTKNRTQNLNSTADCSNLIRSNGENTNSLPSQNRLSELHGESNRQHTQVYLQTQVDASMYEQEVDSPQGNRNYTSPDFETVLPAPKAKQISKKLTKFPRIGNKPKPQLDFLTDNKAAIEDGISVAAKKRKLYSTNYNHYFS